jgi:hypothetical protein
VLTKQAFGIVGGVVVTAGAAGLVWNWEQIARRLNRAVRPGADRRDEEAAIQAISDHPNDPALNAALDTAERQLDRGAAARLRNIRNRARGSSRSSSHNQSQISVQQPSGRHSGDSGRGRNGGRYEMVPMQRRDDRDRDQDRDRGQPRRRGDPSIQGDCGGGCARRGSRNRREDYDDGYGRAR